MHNTMLGCITRLLNSTVMLHYKRCSFTAIHCKAKSIQPYTRLDFWGADRSSLALKISQKSPGNIHQVKPLTLEVKRKIRPVAPVPVLKSWIRSKIAQAFWSFKILIGHHIKCWGLYMHVVSWSCCIRSSPCNHYLLYSTCIVPSHFDFQKTWSLTKVKIPCELKNDN